MKTRLKSSTSPPSKLCLVQGMTLIDLKVKNFSTRQSNDYLSSSEKQWKIPGMLFLLLREKGVGDVNWSLRFTLPNPVVRSNSLKFTCKCWEDTSFCIGWCESEIESSNCPCSIYVCFLGDEFLMEIKLHTLQRSNLQGVLGLYHYLLTSQGFRSCRLIGIQHFWKGSDRPVFITKEPWWHYTMRLSLLVRILPFLLLAV